MDRELQIQRCLPKETSIVVMLAKKHLILRYELICLDLYLMHHEFHVAHMELLSKAKINPTVCLCVIIMADKISVAHMYEASLCKYQLMLCTCFSIV